MSENNIHKNQLSNEQAEFIISKALREESDIQMSDEMFDKLWDNAKSHKSNRKTLRLKFYAVAAGIALMVSLSGTWFFYQSQTLMKDQYEQSTMALNKVSKYLNLGLSKLEHVEEYQKAVEHLEVLEKPNNEVEKLNQLNKIPLIIK